MVNMSALELAAAIWDKRIGVAEVVRAYIDRNEKSDGRLNAFLTVSKENALARAEAIQARINAGESISALAGVPIALKDNAIIP